MEVSKENITISTSDKAVFGLFGPQILLFFFSLFGAAKELCTFCLVGVQVCSGKGGQ